MHNDRDRGFNDRGFNDSRNYNRRDPRDSRDGRGGQDMRDRPRRGTPLSELDPALTEVSRKVIGCAIEVHMDLGPGYEESVYAKALQIEMEAQGVTFKPAQPFEVYFDDKVVGTVIADLWVADRFIVEVMARPGEIGGYERAQLRAQLRAADVELGLIINFGERRLKDGLVRVLNPDKLNELKGEGDEDGEYEDEAPEGAANSEQ
jgi:GxxExxY protein